MKSKMPSFEFVLHLSGDAAVTADFVEAAYEAGCDDATFAVVAGRAEATFHREAPTFADAVISAVENITSADPSVEVSRVERIDEGNDLVNLSDIAEFMEPRRTRESVRKLVAGERGPGGFPPPVSKHKQVAYWRRSDVRRWLQKAGLKSVTASDDDTVKVAEVLNSLLTLQRHRVSATEAQKLYGRLRNRPAQKQKRPVERSRRL